jgi:UDP-glucuronate 4-epimerase
MNDKKVLVTGACGFIGFHLALKFLKNSRATVYGIDSLNSYYSVKLKKKRLLILKKKKNFIFIKKNLSDFKFCKRFFTKHKFDFIYHIAGQAGVLYSLKNPKSYIKNNINATKNLVWCIKNSSYKFKKFFFASSSSVYGDQKKFPLKENSILKPRNPYAYSKKKCEDIILFNFKNCKNLDDFAIFRLFTVFGPYGRPDMLLIKILLNIFYKKVLKIYNYGNYYRDFTYVNDVVKILFLSAKIKTKGKIFNLSSSRPIKLISFIKKVKKILKKDIKIKFMPRRNAEVLKTHGSNKKLLSFFKFVKFSSLDLGLKETIKWFNTYKNKKELMVS